MGTPPEPLTGADNGSQGIGPDQPNTSGTNVNPAWQDVLNVLPEQFHSVVTPHFQKWDQEAQKKIEAANSTLKSYEPYKAFVEHGITPEELEQGLRILYEINNNPRNVYDALAKAYNFGATTSPVADNEGEGDEEYDDTPIGIDPELAAKLEQQEGVLQALAQLVLNDAKAKQDAQADAELEAELQQLKKDHGDYDERYVLAMMLNGMSGEEAVKSYQDLQARILNNRPFAPNVLSTSASGGSGLPSQTVDVTKLSGKETRALVAQMLEQAARARQ